MKKLLLISILSVSLVFILSACTPNLDATNTDSVDSKPIGDNLVEVPQSKLPYKPADRVYLDEESLVTIPKEKTGLKSIGGIWVNEKGIVVSDRDGNKLVLLDKEGNVIKEVGKIGMGPLEFSSPTDIFYNKEDNCIYVLDAGNQRVQVLSTDLVYIKEISLKKLEETEPTNYLSIAADKDNIYVSFNAVTKEKLRIYCVSQNGEVEKTQLIASGTFFQNNSKLYLAEGIAFEFIPSKENPEMFDTLGLSGQTYLYEIDGIETKKIADFPFMYTPSDVVVVQDDIYYVMSNLWNLMESFKLEDGKFVYQKTLTPQIPLDKKSNHGYMMSLFDNTIYIANGTRGDIYIVPLD